MKKIMIFLAFALVMIAAVSFVFVRMEGIKMPKSGDDGLNGGARITIAASFYPLYFFASRIGGSRAEVLNMTPSGVEPHDYELTPKDMANIGRSRLIIVNGGGLEPWSDRIEGIVDASKTKVIAAANGVLTRKEEGGDGAEIDPHAWLSPIVAGSLAQSILEGFVAVDPGNAEEYRKNAKALQEELSILDVEYRDGLAHCESRDIVTAHSAFGYLASSYGLRQMPIAGLSPDAEPSLKDLGNIAAFARSSGVRYIFFESLSSPKLAEAIAKEVGVGTLVLNPIEGLTPDEEAAGMNYFSEMRSNLSHLRQALSCMK